MFVCIYNKILLLFAINYIFYSDATSYNTYSYMNKNSDLIASNYFNSNHFNAYSTHFNSNHFNSNHLNAYSNQVSYCSNIFSQESSTQNNMLTIVPKSYSYKMSSTLAPTYEPTSTLTPTTTLAPTSGSVEVMSFITELGLSNVETPNLDSLTKQSVVIIATANTMNISVTYVTFVSSSILQSQKNRDIHVQGFNLITRTKTSIPLQGKYSVFASNPNSLYTTLSTNMINAVSSGVFTNYLVAASLALNSTSMIAASVATITVSTPIIENLLVTTLYPTSYPTLYPTLAPTYTTVHDKKSKVFYVIFLYVLFTLLLFGLLVHYIKQTQIYCKEKMLSAPVVEEVIEEEVIEEEVREEEVIEEEVIEEENIVLTVDNEPNTD